MSQDPWSYVHLKMISIYGILVAMWENEIIFLSYLSGITLVSDKC